MARSAANLCWTLTGNACSAEKTMQRYGIATFWQANTGLSTSSNFRLRKPKNDTDGILASGGVLRSRLAEAGGVRPNGTSITSVIKHRPGRHKSAPRFFSTSHQLTRLIGSKVNL